jgi:hypothetical protein
LLFEKFSQVDQTDARKFGESFLGLAISHRLGGGDVWAIGVTSIVGELAASFDIVPSYQLTAAPTPPRRLPAGGERMSWPGACCSSMRTQ